MSLNSVHEALELVIDWENKLLSCYEGIHDQLQSERTKLALDYLLEQQKKTVMMLQKLNPEDYKQAEFTKEAPDYKSKKIVPHIDITELSNAEELLTKVAAYEEKLKAFYDQLLETSNHDKSKELFQNLSQTKIDQVKSVKSVLDGWDLSA